MKKKLTIVLVTMGVLGTVFTGCGKEETNADISAPVDGGVQTEASVDAGAQTVTDAEAQVQAENSGEVNTLTGTLEEKKDMLFIIADANGEAYSISFDTAPEGYDQLKAGDAVVMEYTGELSVVDAFTGELISLKLAE